MIAQFALRLMCGMSLTWCVMPRRNVTSGYFRIQMLVTLGLAVLAALAVGRLSGARDEREPILSANSARLLCAAAAALSFVGSVLWTLERRRAGTVCAAALLVLSATVLLLSSVTTEMLGTNHGVLVLLSEVSTSTMVGGTMAAMLLGHWYLTAPTMSIEPLKKLTLYLGIAAAVRLVLSGIGLGLASAAVPECDQIHWLWLALRWLAGIVGPLMVAVMSWRILKYRNTQAATGVLFVGVILTFIGELSATLLYEDLSLPL